MSNLPDGNWFLPPIKTYALQCSSNVLKGTTLRLHMMNGGDIKYVPSAIKLSQTLLKETKFFLAQMPRPSE
nr:MAG TPA: hypothetical protein [Caudoviricetes sp.]